MFQFRLRSLLLLTTAFAVVFGVCRAAELPVGASLLVAALLIVSLAGAFAMVTALAHSIHDRDDE